MTQTADSAIVQLSSLRFKPANSNQADRSGVSHQFNNVPRCSFARDDGISPYLGSETGIDRYPSSAVGLEPLHADIPHPAPEPDKPRSGAHRRLLRSGFALSVFLHAGVALALGVFVAKAPDDALIQGETVISLIVQGDDSDVDARVSGDETAKDLEVEEPQQETVEKAKPDPAPVPKPVEPPPIAKVEPEPPPVVPATSEQVLKDAPMPMLGAALPEILTATTPAEAKVAEIAKPVVQEPPKEIEEIKPEPPKPIDPPKVETKPVEEKKPEPPKPVEKEPELKKPDPKPVVEKEKPKTKPVKKTVAKKDQKKRKGQNAKQEYNADRGRTDAKSRGQSSKDASRGAANREVGNAAASNYKGLVQKKLSRAQKRVRVRGEGSLVLSFTITANGGVSGARISRSSGDPKLDQAALALLDRAAPFPAIPTETGKKSWKMTVPIEFR
ncbi:energy transducer TonB [Rhizobium sp. TRM95796]|uniref:energy transducer TonB family protein n=1 Tax=Rhizobium sp. TRM95796 TaxID=2979862 RepID=UPI0021E7D32E|nr:energy transducer TonB [Rhizobium sp. TRM95796]MCV3766856.1 TonB family protein [Rhizobium sp. TRM95796]